VNAGSQGILVEVLKSPFKKTEQCYDSFMLATYIDPANGQYNKKLRARSKPSKIPLKMILAPRIVHLAQKDLIDMGVQAVNGATFYIILITISLFARPHIEAE
jgi:hypothetical protein